MEHKTKELPKNEIELTVTLSDDEMQMHLKKATEEISRDIKVKGFRPGNVPVHILEQYVDKKYIKAHAQDMAIKKTYSKIIVDKKIPVAGRPKVEVQESEKGFSYKAIIPVEPKIEIKDYKDIKIKKEDIKVTDKDIEEVLDVILKKGVTYEKVDRKAKKGDRVEVDFEGFDEKGKPVENTLSKNHPVVLGEGTLIEGFEEELIGLKPGEKKEFEITFPKDYLKEDFQNKKMKFKVKLKLVTEAKMPELTKEFIKKITGKEKTPEELKKDIKKNVTAKKEQEAKNKRENAYVEKLIKKMKVELPDSLIEQETENIMQDLKSDIEHKGAEFEKFLENSKITIEDLKKKYKGEAEKRIKTRLALKYVIEQEKIDVKKEEVKKELDRIKSFYPEKEHAKIDEDFKSGNLANSIVNRLVIRKLFDKVLN